MEPFKLDHLKAIPKPATLEDCHALIQHLGQMLVELSQQVERVVAENRHLQNENRHLKELLTLNSSNSSLPPSRDSRKKKKNKHSSSGRPSGGQPGHPGHFRQLLDSDKVDTMVPCPLPPHCVCGGTIALETDYQRHQVYELPMLKLHVTEYQLAKGRCLCCQQKHIAALPAGVTFGITGPRLTSFMTELVAKYQVSRRALQEFLKTHFDFSLSLGTVFNKQRLVNEALAAPVAALLPVLKQSPHLNTDETGHRHQGKSAWLWVIASVKAAYVEMFPARGKKALQGLLGDYQSIVISDRYAVYNYFESSQRQLCWAHLTRDFTRLAERRDPVIARLGKGLLQQKDILFEHWGAFKEGKITREELQRVSQPIRRRIGEYLEQGTYTDPHLRAARFCKNLLKIFDALWTFVDTEHLEPTNNHAERCLRPLVIWRKKYLGTQATYGAEYVARTASWIITCKLQSKNAFEYLYQAVTHHFSHRPAPSLMAQVI